MQTTTPKTSGLRRWHRRVAWLALAAALCFALTGSLHPLMTRFQPKPARFAPPPAPALSEALPGPAAALTAVGITELASLRLVDDGARWLWRARLPGGTVRYLDAFGGQALPEDTERAQAERLARWYSGETQAALSQIEPYSRPLWRDTTVAVLRHPQVDGTKFLQETEIDAMELVPQRIRDMIEDARQGTLDV